MASSEHPDEAKEFIAFLTTEGQRIRYETNGDIPLDLAEAEAIDWAAGIPGREEGLEILSHARPLVFVPNALGRDRAVLRRLGVRDRRREVAQEALDEAAPAIQENLDKAWSAWEQQG